MVRGALHGIARYALELAHLLPRLEPSWQFVGLTGPDGLPDDLGALTPHIPLVSAATPEFLSPFEQPALASSLVCRGPTCSTRRRSRCRRCGPASWWPPFTTRTTSPCPRSGQRCAPPTTGWWWGRGRAPASALITVSEFSREEIARPPGPVARAPPGDLQRRRPGVPTRRRRSCWRTSARAAACRPATSRPSAAPRRTRTCSMLVPIVDQLPASLVLLAGRGAQRELGFPESVLELSPLPDADLVRFYARRHRGAGALALRGLRAARRWRRWRAARR